MRTRWIIPLGAVFALVLGGCSAETAATPASPSSSSTITTSAPVNSPSPAQRYSDSKLARSAERIMNASRQGQIPQVAFVALRRDRTGVTVYFETLPGDVDETTTILTNIGTVPVSLAQGDAPTPT